MPRSVSTKVPAKEDGHAYSQIDPNEVAKQSNMTIWHNSALKKTCTPQLAANRESHKHLQDDNYSALQVYAAQLHLPHSVAD